MPIYIAYYIYWIHIYVMKENWSKIMHVIPRLFCCINMQHLFVWCMNFLKPNIDLNHLWICVLWPHHLLLKTCKKMKVFNEMLNLFIHHMASSWPLGWSTIYTICKSCSLSKCKWPIVVNVESILVPCPLGFNIH